MTDFWVRRIDFCNYSGYNANPNIVEEKLYAYAVINLSTSSGLFAGKPPGMIGSSR
ncbi:MAG TPA: hypothetical protein VF326_04355 [Anaerolineaceae bacterium]